MFRHILILRLIVAIAVNGACDAKAEAQVPILPSESAHESVNRCGCLSQPAVREQPASTGRNVEAGISAAGSLVVELSPAECFGAWLLLALTMPWLLSCLIQCVMRSDSLTLQAVLLLCWMVAVVASSWAFWGAGLPVTVFAALSVPSLGGTMPYFAFVMERLDTMPVRRQQHA